MSTPIKGNSPAFPCPATGKANSETSITIRAYMATKFAAALVAKAAFDQPSEDMMKKAGTTGAKNVERFICMMACDFADALIAELNKKG